MALSQPTKPPRNDGTDESFDEKFRNECQSMEYFRDDLKACIVIKQRQRNTTQRGGGWVT
jgi:putative transposase